MPGRPSLGRARLARVVLTRMNAWVPALLWAGLIFALSAIPHLGTGLGVWDLILRKLAHAAEYAILGALVFRACRNAPGAVLIASAYAVTDEVHQTFVRARHGSPVDWLIDSVGALVGVVLVARASR